MFSLERLYTQTDRVVEGTLAKSVSKRMVSAEKATRLLDDVTKSSSLVHAAASKRGSMQSRVARSPLFLSDFIMFSITDTLLYYCSIGTKNQPVQAKESLNHGKKHILRETCFIFVLNVLQYEKKLVTLHLERLSKRLKTQIKAVKRNLNNKKITWTRIGQLTRTAL